MKKILLVTSGLLLLTVVVILVTLKTILPSKIKGLVEQQGTQAIGQPMKLESVEIDFFPPVTVVLNHIKTSFKPPLGAQVEITRARARVPLFDLLSKNIHVDVLIESPQMLVVLPDENDTGKKSPPPGKSAAPETKGLSGPSGYKISLELSVVNGVVNATQALKNSVALKNLQLLLDVPDLEQVMTLRLSTQAEVNWNGFKNAFPIQIASDFSFKNGVLETKTTSLEVLGLTTNLKGSFDTVSGSQFWDAALDIKDLSQVKGLSSFLPDSAFAGTLQSRIHAEQPAGGIWTMSGGLKAQGIKGQLAYSRDAVSAKGQASADLDVDFSAQRKFSVDKIVGHADLGDLSLVYGKKLFKPAKIPCSISVDATAAEGAFAISQAELVFAALSASASGRVATGAGQNSELHIQVKRTDLSGFEKFFPVLAQAPLQGFVEMKGTLQGDLQNLQQLSISLNPLLLKDIRGSFQWVAEDKSKSLHGPATLDAQAIVVAKGTHLSSANIKAKADLTGMDLEMGDKFSKKAGSPFKFELNADQKGDSIQVSRSRLMTAAGTLSLKGTIKEPQAPALKLSLEVGKLSLSALSQMIPMLQPFRLDGAASGDLTLNGKYDFAKGIGKSPLSLQGTVSASIPQFVRDSPQAAVGKSASTRQTEAPPEKAPEAILPDWPIMRSASLHLSLHLGRFMHDKLVVNRIDWKGGLNAGVLSGSGSVGEVFGGSIGISRLKTPLLQAAPTSEMDVSAKGVDISRALEWMSPEWKGLAAGNASGKLSMRVPHPSRKDFMETTRVSGDVEITNGFLSTLRFDQLVKNALSQLPGIGERARSLSTKGASANIQASFALAKAVVAFSKFNMATPEKNELRSQGWVKLDKTFDLKGNVYLSDPPVKGSIHEANADASGRLVLPVHFSGNVFNPETNLGSETAQVLLSRTADYEAAKARKQAEARLREETRKQVDQQRKRVEDEAKSKLKSILGQ